MKSNKELFAEVERSLRRELTPDERRFLILANLVLSKEPKRELGKEQSIRALLPNLWAGSPCA